MKKVLLKSCSQHKIIRENVIATTTTPTPQLIMQVTNVGNNLTTTTAAATTTTTTTPVTPATTTTSTTDNNAYQQRRSHVSIYSELFSALLRLPDKKVQERVLAAINGSVTQEQTTAAAAANGDNSSKICTQCQQKKNYVNASTQTEKLTTTIGAVNKCTVVGANKKLNGTTTTTNIIIRRTSNLTPIHTAKSKINIKLENDKSTTTTATTTTTSETQPQTNNQLKAPTLVAKKEPVASTEEASGAAAEETECDECNGTKLVVPAKRGRKRKNRVPQVVKRSHALQMLQEREDKQLTPLTTKKRRIETTAEKNNEKTTKSTNNNNDSTTKDSLQVDPSLVQCLDINSLNQLIDEEDFVLPEPQRLIKTMAKEYLEADDNYNGLRPIHNAVLANDIFKLQRQIYVWTRLRGCDLNDVLTNDDEDCLELAIISDCEPKIMSILLETNLATNNIYENSNTVIHLAILNNIERDCLQQLMKKIDLHILLIHNDDGYTPMHLAVRHNQYYLAEIICNGIDQRERGAPLYKLSKELTNEAQHVVTDDTPKARKQAEEQFARYYERCCSTLQTPSDWAKIHLKRQLLDAGEKRGGNSALFYAIENEMEHFAYFLLAHLSDPNALNHSAQSPRLFHYEFARLLQMSLKVARVMDRVCYILPTTTT